MAFRQGRVWMVRAGSQFNAVGELESVAGTPPAVSWWDALQDDQTSRAQDRDRPDGGIFGDPDAAGDIANTNGRDPAMLSAMGGEGQVLESGPGRRTQLSTPNAALCLHDEVAGRRAARGRGAAVRSACMAIRCGWGWIGHHFVWDRACHFGDSGH